MPRSGCSALQGVNINFKKKLLTNINKKVFIGARKNEFRYENES